MAQNWRGAGHSLKWWSPSSLTHTCVIRPRQVNLKKSPDFHFIYIYFDTRYLVFYNPSPPRMFLSLDFLSEYRIQHGAIGPLYVTSSYWTGIFCRGVSGFGTDCPCDVWCRGLTTCLLHVGPPFGNWFLPEASFGLRVLLLPACVCVCVSMCVCVRQSWACPCDNSSTVQARITKFGPEM